MIEIIDTLGQKNNGLFPLVDSNAVRGGFYQVDTIEERDSIPAIRRKDGMLCYVKDHGMFQLVGSIDNTSWTVFSSGEIDTSGFATKEDLETKANIKDLDTKANRDELNAKANIEDLDTKADKESIDNIYTELGNKSSIDHYHSYLELNDTPTIPTKVSDIENDVGFITINDVVIPEPEDDGIYIGDTTPNDESIVWIDTSDVGELTSNIPEVLIEEFRAMFKALQQEMASLRNKNAELEARVEYLEMHGGGGGTNPPDPGTNSYVLTFEDGSTMTFEDGSIMTFEGTANVSSSTFMVFEDNSRMLFEDGSNMIFEKE